MALLAPMLYYQGADLPVHRPTKDPRRLYELRPGFSMTLHGRKISINALGFRDKERSARKPRGVFRIFCLGSSNTYGAAVNDDETYPARLEALLNKRAPGRYEVWNAGTSAYVLSQSEAWAEEIARDYAPDLVILQYYNPGRKPFLLGYPYADYFERAPSLWLENLRWLPFSSTALDLALLRRWRFFRLIVVALNRAGSGSANNPRYNVRGMEYADVEPLMSQRAFPVAALSIDPDGRHSDPFAGTGVKTLFLRDRVPKNAPPEFLEVHPPAYVYKWYAETLAAWLASERLLPR